MKTIKSSFWCLFRASTSCLTRYDTRLEASEHRYQRLVRDSDGLCDDVAKVLESVATRIQGTQAQHERTIAANVELQQRVTQLSEELVAKNDRVQFLETQLRNAGIDIDSDPRWALYNHRYHPIDRKMRMDFFICP